MPGSERRRKLTDVGSVWQMLEVSDRYRKRHTGYGKKEKAYRCRKCLADVGSGWQM
jgi:hypothetical protein